ncbi:hypothetical protein Tco_0525581 [Tanacetum coccineum]
MNGTRHQRQYERMVNKRQMQTQESKIDTGKAVDNGLVVMKSNGTESEVQDESSKVSGMIQMLDDAESDLIMMKSQWLRYRQTANAISLLWDNRHTSN